MESLLKPIEIVSVCCSIIFIVGSAKQKLWSWFFGIAGAGLACILFFYQQLYSETYLQALYVGMGVYGWYKWKQLEDKKRDDEETTISEIQFYKHLLILIVGFTIVYLSGTFFKNYTSAAYPYLDAFTSVFAIAATLLETRKILSCWYYWLAVNPLSIWLYVSKGMFVYSILGVIFSVMSVIGLILWLKSMKKPEMN